MKTGYANLLCLYKRLELLIASCPDTAAVEALRRARERLINFTPMPKIKIISPLTDPREIFLEYTAAARLAKECGLSFGRD